MVHVGVVEFRGGADGKIVGDEGGVVVGVVAQAVGVEAVEVTNALLFEQGVDSACGDMFELGFDVLPLK